MGLSLQLGVCAPRPGCVRQPWKHTPDLVSLSVDSRAGISACRNPRGIPPARTLARAVQFLAALSPWGLGRWNSLGAVARVGDLSCLSHCCGLGIQNQHCFVPLLIKRSHLGFHSCRAWCSNQFGKFALRCFYLSLTPTGSGIFRHRVADLALLGGGGSNLTEVTAFGVVAEGLLLSGLGCLVLLCEREDASSTKRKRKKKHSV